MAVNRLRSMLSLTWSDACPRGSGDSRADCRGPIISGEPGRGDSRVKARRH